MAEVEAQRIRRYFEQDTPNFRYLRMLGHGATNVACKVRYRHRWWRYNVPGQNFVVKRPFRDVKERDMLGEFRALEMFEGSMHIIQAATLPQGVRNPIDNAPGPTVLMECLEGGSVWRVVKKRQAQSPVEELPNRMLWRMLLCLVRVCIGMAYPRPSKVPHLETFPVSEVERRNPADWQHGDMHTGNILFGDFEPTLDEHGLTPILKAIDLERCRPIDEMSRQSSHNRWFGVEENLHSAGMAIRHMIVVNAIDTKRHVLPPTRARSFESWAVLDQDSWPHLDRDLADLLSELGAQEGEDRPYLRDVFERVVAGCSRTAAFYAQYPRGDIETDEHITALCRQLILEPDISDNRVEED
ncbi:hypothetical protein F4805DRAFT_443024 [Annulohypoxylon moriforme]|nr:hypothetical protein F4805DRAFT_443024 [Annulohypoxylon moriforme]